MTVLANRQHPYRRALLMAGGGLRLGYYLGIYQALCDTGRVPDLVIGTCGGAMAAALLQRTLASDGHTSRQALLDVMSSRSFYDLMSTIKDKPPNTYGQYLLPALERWVDCQFVKLTHGLFKRATSARLTDELIDDLSSHAIGCVEDEEGLHWRFLDTSLPSDASADVLVTDVLLLASRRTYAQSQDKWQSTLWTSSDLLASAIIDVSPTNVMAQHSPIICPKYHLNDFALSIMVQASMTDMYYLPPLRHGNEILMGGVLDLFPIELACQLAQVVYAEPKNRFDEWLATPAIYRAFGYLPNTRLDSVLDYMAKSTQVHCLHTKDYRCIRPMIDKKPSLRQDYIKAGHVNFHEFNQIITEQFDYGYRVGLASEE